MGSLRARRVCITGGAGFIGSNLADRVLAAGVEVTILDDFSTGRREFVADALGDGGARLVEGDVLDPSALEDALSGCDLVFHMQANADVRHGLEHPRRDLEQNTLATAAVLEVMRAHAIERIVFASTGSVYGEPSVFPTPEDAPFPIQTSLYAASKLAGEALIEAYAAGYGFSGVICRFVSILGERYTHGHLFDFYRALERDPTRLLVLGDGRQEKSYLYVQDCIDGLLLAAERHYEEPGAHIYNLGTEETIVVDDSIRILTRHRSLSPRIEHTGGRRGWVGDSPLIRLDTARIRALGWRPQLRIEQAIARTLDWFDANEYAWREPASIAPQRRSEKSLT
jgi:UDP-glucose 4-epimerase